MPEAREGRAKGVVTTRHAALLAGAASLTIGALFLLSARSTLLPSGPEPVGSRSGQLRDGSATRVVSLVPGASALLVALGAADLVVGRTLDDATPELAERAIVGRVLTPNAETIVALQPDVVVMWAGARHPSLEEVLGPGVRVMRVSLDRLEDASLAARALGAAVGMPEEGIRLSDELDAALASTRSTRAPCKDLVAAWVVEYVPPIVAGSETHLDDLMTHVGVVNAFADAVAPWPRPSLEVLVARRIDLLIWPVGHDLPPFADLPNNAPWSRTAAGRAGRVIEVDADLMHEVGPRVGEASSTLSDEVRDACRRHRVTSSSPKGNPR